MNTQRTKSRAFAISGALLGGLLLAAMVAGCGGRRYRASYTATATPQMAYVDDGLWAVTDYDDPVFYSGDYYWRYDDGYWYRSGYLGGWNRVRVSAVPPRILRIDRPRRYRHYTPRRSVRVRPVPQRHYRPHVRRADTRVRRPQGRVVRPRQRVYDDRRGARRDLRRDRRDRRIDRRMDRREARRDARRYPR